MRIGTPALTTRGMKEEEMKYIAGYCLKAIEIAKRIQEKAGKKLEDFIKMIPEDPEVASLAAEVKAFASAYPMPGN